jgi:adenosylcobinamide-phosphate synthase
MLSGLSWPWLAVLMALGIALDLLLGEARRWHPLVGFGNLAKRIEGALNHARRCACAGCWPGAWRCAAGAGGLRLADRAVAWWLAALLHAALLYFCIGLRSLREHTLPIARRWPRRSAAGAAPDLLYRQPRHRQSSEGELAKAGVESLLENGNDAVFGTLFWFLVAGGPGPCCSAWPIRWMRCGATATRVSCISAGPRPASTMPQLAARPPDRLFLRLAGPAARPWPAGRRRRPPGQPQRRPGDGCRRRCTGPGLGGPAIYDGEVEQRPPLGRGLPQGPDIVRAWRLVAMSTALWLAVACAVALLWPGEASCLNTAATSTTRRAITAARAATGWTCPPASIRVLIRRLPSPPTPGIACRSLARAGTGGLRLLRRAPLLAVAGTQAAIQACRNCACARMGPAQVVVAAPIYAEHAHCWRRAGHLCAKCRMTAG